MLEKEQDASSDNAGSVVGGVGKAEREESPVIQSDNRQDI